MGNDINQNDMVKRAHDFAHSAISNNIAYHNHKERMGYTALLLQIAIFAAIMIAEYWPLKWIPDITIQVSAKGFTILIICTLWVAIHAYVRWQFRLRRKATFIDSALRTILSKWVTTPPKEDDLGVNQIDKPKKDRVRKFFDYFFPAKRAPMPYGEEKRQYPKAIADELDRQERDGISPIFSEWCLTIGSVLMLVLIIYRTIVSNNT